jgi:hypothetical protein
MGRCSTHGWGAHDCAPWLGDAGGTAGTECEGESPGAALGGTPDGSRPILRKGDTARYYVCSATSRARWPSWVAKRLVSSSLRRNVHMRGPQADLQHRQ